MKYFISETPTYFISLYEVYKQYHCKYILLSYYYIQKMRNKKVLIDKLQDFKNSGGEFMLDSGVFTFFKEQQMQQNFLEQYLKSYVFFIKENYDLIDYFIEFDLDVILGYEQVRNIQNFLINEFGYEKLIAVWHPERKWSGFISMLKEFKYIALALSNVYRIEIPDVLIDKMTIFAKKLGVKVHGLGYLRNDVYKRFFDSVDSSSVAACRTYGEFLSFNFYKLRKVKKKGVYRKNIKYSSLLNIQEHTRLQSFLQKIDNFSLLKK